MKARERNKRAPPADLLVCFPTRSHLKLMPKPTTCSPSRPSSVPASKRFLHHHHLKKSGSGATTSMLLLKNKHMESDMSEPTSPKVTCAGQIKVRPKNGGSCKNWQSVMEEIEKLHNNNKKTKKIKKPNWAEALGFKKDVMQFLTCLRTIRFDFRCFGSFPSAVDITSSDDEDDDDDDEEEEEEEEEDKDNAEVDVVPEEDVDKDNSKAVFSKWFMLLQENQDTKEASCDNKDHHQSANIAPPSNALLLMRCRSAPAKSWLQDEDEDEEKEKEAEMVNEEQVKRKKILEENNLVVMKYDSDFYKLSCDIAKETWVVGGLNKDQMSRSRSCKR